MEALKKLFYSFFFILEKIMVIEKYMFPIAKWKKLSGRPRF